MGELVDDVEHAVLPAIGGAVLYEVVDVDWNALAAAGCTTRPLGALAHGDC